MKIIVTGGAGFIGSAVVRRLVNDGHQVLNLDNLTYAGNLKSVAEVTGMSNYRYARADICSGRAVSHAINEFQPDAIMHLAAESHVDRSIQGPLVFVQTNVVGTAVLLEAAYEYWVELSDEQKRNFRFIHVSTDEVFGDLGTDGGQFTEDSPYRPSSPYAASKAASDHFARAWNRTFGLPVINTNCSNNIGPFQYPEKLVPSAIRTALAGDAIQIFGDGTNIRDWLYVDDHVSGLVLTLEKGQPGQSYNFGGVSECSNSDLVDLLCSHLDALRPRTDGKSYREQVKFIDDRLGHDLRYSIDSSRARKELGWSPIDTLATSVEKTLSWYLENPEWLEFSDSYGSRVGMPY